MMAKIRQMDVDIESGRIFKKGRELGSIDPGSGYHKTTVSVGKVSRNIKRANIIWWKKYGVWPIEMLDHKNTVRTDDRIDNLRYASNSLNGQNTLGGRKSKYGCPKGVTYNPTKTNKRTVWVATLVRGGQKRHIGRFETMEEAAAAYEAARKAYDEQAT